MRKNLKVYIEQLPQDEPHCLVDMNQYEMIEASGLKPDLVHKKSAHISGAWRLSETSRISFAQYGADLSSYRYLTFSVFSVGGAGKSFHMIFESNDGAEPLAGYAHTFTIAHDGWNDYRVELPFMRAIREPLGWDRINSIVLDSAIGTQSNRANTVLFFDSFFVWKDYAAPLYTTMPELKGAAAFAKNGAYAIVNRRRVALSMDEARVTPFEADGTLWLPMGAIASVLAYSAVADNKAATLSFTYRRKKYAFAAGSKTVTVDGVAEELSFAPMEKEGIVCFPIEFVKEFFNWRRVYVDSMGLIVLSNRKNVFDPVLDAERIWQLVADMTFVRPSGEEMAEALHKKIKSPGRGRVLALHEELMELRKLAKSDGNLKEYLIALKANYGTASAAFRALPISPDVPRTDKELMEDLAASSEKLLAFATLYRTTGDKIYCERAAAEAEALATFADWRGRSMASVAAVALGISVAYDWCKHVWSEARKAVIERAILRNAIRPALEAYAGKRNMWDTGSAGGAMINAGILASALALSDVYPASAMRLFAYVTRNAEAIMESFAPDGGFAEGVVAWETAARGTALLVRMLQTAFGSDYGFASMPGFAATAYFPLYAETENGAWNYHNCAAQAIDTSVLSFFTQETGNPVFAWYRRRELLAGKKAVVPFDILFYTPVDDEKNYELPLDAVYRRAGLAMMRSDWNGEGMTVCLHGGKNHDRDSDLDAGSFILECAGERFFAETGGNEALSMVLRRRAQGQNTMVFQPTADDMPDQNCDATAPICEMRSSADRVYAVVDMTNTSDALVRAKRGVMLTAGRTVAVIQDEAILAESGVAVWTAYTPAEVALNASARVARLTINEKTLLCKLVGIGHPAHFEAETLEESGLTRLTVRVEGKDRVRMAIACSLETADSDACTYEMTPMSKWSEA